VANEISFHCALNLFTGNSPLALQPSFLRSLDHTQQHNLLDEWSAHRKYCYLTTLTAENIHAPCGTGTHNLSRRAAADPCLIPRGHRDRPFTGNRKWNYSNNNNDNNNTIIASKSYGVQCLAYENALRRQIKFILQRRTLSERKHKLWTLRLTGGWHKYSSGLLHSCTGHIRVS
jgi:hypothetical protein